MHPPVNKGHAKDQEWQEEASEYRKRSGSGFQDSADYQSPRAARHVLEHKNGKAAERYANPKDECQQVRTKELLFVEDCADCAKRERYYADDERESPETV